MKKTTAYLKHDLDRAEAVIAETLRSPTRLIDEVGAYLVEGKGKRLRPMVVLLAARLMGADTSGADFARVAAGVELVHLATLLHDDVIDHAATRRGRPSVNDKWGADVAILMADHLFSVAFTMILDHGGTEAVRALSVATSRMCEGEMLQIEKRGRFLDVDDYMRIIEAKTASLFSACAEIGARMNGAAPEAVANLAAFGLNFGVAFQIADDLLDYTAEGKKWGKDVGVDFLNGKQTLPLIHALSVAPGEDREFLMASFSNGRKNLPDVIRLIRKHGGVDRSKVLAREYARAAADRLEQTPANEARDHLERLARGAIERSY